MATITQVAARAGVSEATVSRVINRSAAVSPETARRVVAAVEALRYRPNPRARNLSLGRDPTVLLWVPTDAGAVAAEQLAATVATLSELGRETVVEPVWPGADLDDMAIDVAARRRASAVVVFGGRLEERGAGALREASIPLVVVGRRLTDTAGAAIVCTPEAIARRAVALAGRKATVAHVGPGSLIDVAVRRRLAAVGRPAQRVHPSRAAFRLRRAEAIIATSDAAALAAGRAAPAARVIACGHVPAATEAGLPTVQIPNAAMGVAAADLITAGAAAVGHRLEVALDPLSAGL